MKSIITAVATIMNVNNFCYDKDVDVAHRLNGKFPHHRLSCSAAEKKERVLWETQDTKKYHITRPGHEFWRKQYYLCQWVADNSELHLI